MADRLIKRHTAVLSLSDHARIRMAHRAIRQEQIDQVIHYGRECHLRHAVIYAVGHKEVRTFGRFLEQCDGIHVLCSSDGTVITTYRNHNLRGLRH